MKEIDGAVVCDPCFEGEHDECVGFPGCMCIDMEHDDDG